MLTIKKRHYTRKEKEKQRSYFNTIGIRKLVTHPSTNPTKQGLTLLKKKKLSLWHYDSTLDFFVVVLKSTVPVKGIAAAIRT